MAAVLQVCIGEGAPIIRERNLALATAGEVGVDEIGGSVVRPPFEESRKRRGRWVCHGESMKETRSMLRLRGGDCRSHSKNSQAPWPISGGN